MRASNLATDVLAMIACLFALFVLAIFAWRAARGFSRRRIWFLLGASALFRLLLLPAGVGSGPWSDQLQDDLTSRQVVFEPFLLYDNDIWRYFWDGHVAQSGRSPYTATPYELRDSEAGVELLEQEFWEDVLDNVSYQRYGTVYPPLAQHLFRLHRALTPASVVAFKLLLWIFDLAVCFLLLQLLESLGRPREDVLLYAWNPLVIKEFSGSSHLDVVMIALLLVSFSALDANRHRRALAVFAGAITTKLVPVVLVGVILARVPRRLWWWLPGILGLISLPFLNDVAEMLRGLAVFAREWEFNSGPWAALRWLLARVGFTDPAAASHAAARVVLVGWIAWMTWLIWAGRRCEAKNEHLLMGTFAILAGVLLLSPAVMPWYLLWALPFAILVGCRSWVVLTALSLLSYIFYIDQRQDVWWLWCEYSGFALALFIEWRIESPFATRWRTFRRVQTAG